MAREIMLSDGRTALFDDDATDEDIEKKLRAQNLTRATGAVAPAGEAEPIPGGMPAAAGLSAVNSLMFGVPELIARGFGAGPAIEATRREYPFMTTAGDVAGLINPARLGMKATEKAIGYGMGALKSPAAKEAEQQAIMRTMRATDEANAAQAAQAMVRQPTLREMAGRTAERAASIGGGVMGAQLGAAALGGARQPNQYGAGAQQGAQVFRQAAMSAPGTGLVPGLQSTIGAVTTPVPAAIGYGSAAFNMALERQMREEAARRALQGR